MTIKALHAQFPAEFDKNGGMRAGRVSLNETAKKFFDVRAEELKGRVLKEGEKGWYYLWH